MNKKPKVLGKWQIMRPSKKRLITKKPKLKIMSEEVKQQTAVEWLCQQLEQTIGRSIMLVMESEIEQAKQMEKEQIIETWHNGYNSQSPMIDEENCGQQYYNETFKSE